MDGDYVGSEEFVGFYGFGESIANLLSRNSIYKDLNDLMKCLQATNNFKN